MKRIAVYIGVLFVLCCLAHPSLADDCAVGPPCYGYPDDLPGINCCPVAVPFDGGVILMLAAGGIGMGVRAMRKKKNQ